jgi:hypothetical protein
MVGAAGDRDHRDRRGVRRRSPLKNLGESWKMCSDLVSDETRHADSSGHAEQPAQRDGMVLVKRLGRHFPRGEFRVHVNIERELFLVDKAHRADSSDGFRQRRRLEQRVRSHAIAIGPREGNAVLIDERDADRRDVERGHRLRERELFRRAVNGDGQIALNVRGLDRAGRS